MGKHEIVHIEIAADVVNNAAEFYKEVFNWETRTDEALDYTMWLDGKIGGGFVGIDGKQVQKGDVVIYISSDDVDADMEKIIAKGGKRLSETMDIPTAGTMAHFMDPSGNHLALWKDAGGTSEE